MAEDLSYLETLFEPKYVAFALNWSAWAPKLSRGLFQNVRRVSEITC